MKHAGKNGAVIGTPVVKWVLLIYFILEHGTIAFEKIYPHERLIILLESNLVWKIFLVLICMRIIAKTFFSLGAMPTDTQSDSYVFVLYVETLFFVC